MYKNIRLRIFMIVIIALILSYVSYRYISGFNDETTMIGFSEDLKARTKIVDKYITEEKISNKDKDKFFPNAIQSKEEIIGSVLRIDVNKGEPVEYNNDMFVIEDAQLLLDNKGGIKSSFFIPEGKRIIAINLDSTGAINNTVSQGDFVDIIYTSKEASTGGIYSRIILQHIEIYDVEDVEITKNGVTQQRQNVMLIVTPEESLDIALAGRNGDIDFVLNPLQGSTTATDAKNIHSFVSEPPMSIRDQLDYIMNYTSNSYIPDVSKEDIMFSVSKALDRDMVDLIIRESTLELDTKDRLLEILDQ